MSKELANSLLDKAKEGQDVPVELINIALCITGDIGSDCE